MRDLVENRDFLHDQIDLASGAKKDFNYETWAKENGTIPITNKINAMNFRSRSRSNSQKTKKFTKKSKPPVKGSRTDRLKWSFNVLTKDLSAEDQLMIAATLTERAKMKGNRKPRSKTRRRKPSRLNNLETQEDEVEEDVEEEESQEDYDESSNQESDLESGMSFIRSLKVNIDSNLRLMESWSKSPTFLLHPSLLLKPKKVNIIYDTGASTSCIPIQVIRNLRTGTYEWNDCSGRYNTSDASGNKVNIFDRLINIELRIQGCDEIIKVKNAIVADFPNKNVHSQILLGINDIRRNNINLKINNGNVELIMNNIPLKYQHINFDPTLLRMASNSKHTPFTKNTTSLASSFSEIQDYFKNKNVIAIIFRR